MDAEQVYTDRLTIQTKKTYSKPIINKVRMVAEEAVLGLCKYNDAATGAMCAPDLSCVLVGRS
jgi:hypothetical protein